MSKVYLSSMQAGRQAICKYIYLYVNICVHAGVFMDEYDVATYTIKTLDDPRTLNKTVYLRPPANILSQRELVEMWEKLSGKILEKITISDKDFLASIQGVYVISLTTLTYLLSDLT